VRQEEPINFIGKHLKQSLHPSDYQISFVTDLSTSQSSAIQCVVAELTDTLLTCLPEKLKLLQTFNESGAVTVEAQVGYLTLFCCCSVLTPLQTKFY